MDNVEKMLRDYLADNDSWYNPDKISNIQHHGDLITFDESQGCPSEEKGRVDFIEVIAWVYSKVDHG